MKCLRCNAEMKQYNFNGNWGIYGKEYDPGNGYAIRQNPHNPESIYECPKYCENEDI